MLHSRFWSDDVYYWHDVIWCGTAANNTVYVKWEIPLSSVGDSPVRERPPWLMRKTNCPGLKYVGHSINFFLMLQIIDYCHQWLKCLGMQGNKQHCCTSDYWQIAFLYLQVRKKALQGQLYTAKWQQHTHPFNGPLSRTTRVSRYQKGKPICILLKQETVSGSGSYLLGHMQVCTLLQTDNHASTPPLSFLQAGCPSCRPTSSVKALKATNDNNCAN